MIYLKYLLRVLHHKWCVLLAGLKVGKIPFWRLLIHDWSKFTLKEFTPYARYFLRGRKEKDKLPFMLAWHHHVIHNPHHWEHWILNPTYTFSVAENGRLPIMGDYKRTNK